MIREIKKLSGVSYYLIYFNCIYTKNNSLDISGSTYYRDYFGENIIDYLKYKRNVKCYTNIKPKPPHKSWRFTTIEYKGIKLDVW